MNRLEDWRSGYQERWLDLKASVADLSVTVNLQVRSRERLGITVALMVTSRGGKEQRVERITLLIST
jgi:hypothetical protein